jgi:hypothetical protein
MFVASLRVLPEVTADSGCGFLVLRSMQRGAAFNVALMPDPLDITRDVGAFQTWWSPGQYLVPGMLETLGLRIGVAISLTILLATVCGLVGWRRVATMIDAPRGVTNQFVFGLATVHFVQAGFRVYHGGEVLLFACAPWALLAVLYALRSGPMPAFGITILAGAILFFAKLTGLVVLAAIIIGVSAVEIASARRLRPPVIGIWLAAIVLVMLLQQFWLSRGATPMTAAGDGLSPCSGVVQTARYNPFTFSIASAALSGVSGLTMVSSLASRPLPPVLPKPHITLPLVSVLAICLIAWIWWCLRTSQYRQWALRIGAIVLAYIAILVTLYLSGSEISYEERHLRFSGILIFLLFLMATATRTTMVRYVGPLVAGFFGLYGAASYVTGVPRILREQRSDPTSGVTVRATSPAVLAYVRERQHVTPSGERPLVVAPVEVAANLRGFRLLPFHVVESAQWHGLVRNIYVVPRADALSSARWNSLLSAFATYDRRSWREVRFGNFVVFSQAVPGAP